jgi:hypothetical protein
MVVFFAPFFIPSTPQEGTFCGFVQVRKLIYLLAFFCSLNCATLCSGVIANTGYGFDTRCMEARAWSRRMKVGMQGGFS